MKRTTVGIILIVLGVAAIITASLGVWPRAPFPTDQDYQPPIIVDKNNPSDEDSSDEDTQKPTDEDKDDSSSHTTGDVFSGSTESRSSFSDQSLTEDWTVSLQVPPVVQTSNPQQGVYSFKYIGPNSQPATEITDGFLVTITAHTNTSLPAYLDTAQAPTGTETITFNGYEAASFSRPNELDNQRIPHIVFMLEDETTAIDITYASYGESSARYQEVIEDMLDTVTFDEVREEDPNDLLIIDKPAAGSTVESPLLLSGEARGYWFFEASAPVTLKNAEGTVIGEGYIETENNRMTEAFIPFSGEIEYQYNPTTSGTIGKLIFHRANPSGLPENDMAVAIPIQLEGSTQ